MSDYTIDQFVLSDTGSNANRNTTVARFIDSSDKTIIFKNQLTDPTVQAQFKQVTYYKTREKDWWGNWSYSGDSQKTETEFTLDPTEEYTFRNPNVKDISSTKQKHYRAEFHLVKVIPITKTDTGDTGLSDTESDLEVTDEPDTSTVPFLEKYKIWLIAVSVIISVMILIFFLWKKNLLPGVN